MSRVKDLRKDFVVLTLLGAMTSMAGIIDSSFANNIGIDEICVAAACGAIENVCYALISVGSQASRTTNRNRRMCCIVQMLLSFVIAFLAFTFSRSIVKLFAFKSQRQLDLLNTCIRACAIMYPMRAVNWFYDYYIQLKGYNKLYSISSIVWVVVLILTDILALKWGWGLPGMLFMSGVSSFIQNIVFVVGLVRIGKFHSNDVGRVGFKEMLEVFRVGVPRVIMNTFARATRSATSVILSSLPSRQYAVIGVCSSVMLYVKSTSTDANYKIVVRNLFKYSKRVLKKDMEYALKIFKELVLTAFFANTFLGISFLIICHGKVSILECLPYLMCMLCALIAISVSETIYSVMNIHLWDKILVSSSIIGSLGAIAVTWVLVRVGWGHIAGIWGTVFGMEMIRCICYCIAIKIKMKKEETVV